MCRSDIASGMPASFYGDGLLRVSLKCFVQRNSCFFSVIKRLPCLSLTSDAARSSYT